MSDQPLSREPGHFNGLLCAQCGFDLKTTDLEGDCPECGYAVAKSQTADAQFWGNPLLASRARWAWRLLGVWLILLVLLALMLGDLLTGLMMDRLQWRNTFLVQFYGTMVCFFCSKLFLVLGLWFVWQRIPVVWRKAKRLFGQVWLCAMVVFGVAVAMVALLLGEWMSVTWVSGDWVMWLFLGGELLVLLIECLMAVLAWRGSLLLGQRIGKSGWWQVDGVLPLLVMFAGNGMTLVLFLTQTIPWMPGGLDDSLLYLFKIIMLDTVLFWLNLGLMGLDLGETLVLVAAIWGLVVWFKVGRRIRKRFA